MQEGHQQHQKKLVILCLHGFRQNASQLRGRLRGLQRRLADIATFEFLDAPHVLPLWLKTQQQQAHEQHGGGMQQQLPGKVLDERLNQRHHQQHQNTSPVSTDAPGIAPAPRRAWLVAEDLLDAQPHLQAFFQHQWQLKQQQQQQQKEGEVDASSPADGQSVRPGDVCAWQAAPADVATEEQYRTQTCGWAQSWQVLQEYFTSNPHVDGLLGFSQGAAVATVVAALAQQQQQQQQSLAAAAKPARHHTTVACDAWMQPAAVPQLKFVILGSGFVSEAAEHVSLLQQQQPLSIPSLHIYACAATGSDRQIQHDSSQHLLGVWDVHSRQEIVHSSGHVIPCDRETVGYIRGFLGTFL